MLEKDCIQSLGFRNVVKDGEVKGFQIKVRSIYYRGLWLSQIRPATIKVDDITYKGEQITWVINGKEYTQEEMKSIGDVHWDITEPATLSVKKQGGLKSGFHDVEFEYGFSSSYMPPNMDGILAGGVHKRRLILV